MLLLVIVIEFDQMSRSKIKSKRTAFAKATAWQEQKRKIPQKVLM